MAQRKRTTGPENQVKLPSEAYVVCCYLSLTHIPKFISLISHVTASHSEAPTHTSPKHSTYLHSLPFLLSWQLLFFLDDTA